MSGETLRLLLLFSCLSSFLGFVWPQALTERPLPSRASPELPPDVLTDQLLTPPLRGIATLRFSPNGRYLLVQDGAGIFVASREPLRLVFYADAPNAYPARFSNDSETISLLTHELILATWRLPDAKAIGKRELLLPAGCLDAQLAPGAGWIACLTPEMTVNLYRAGDLANVFSQRIGSGPPPNVIVPIRLHAESAFAAPFGFTLSSTLASLANRGAFRVPAEFSPAGDFLLFSQERNNSLRLDLPNLTRTNLPGAIRKHAFNRFTILPDNSAVLPDLKETSSFSIVSLTSGQTLSKLSLPFDHISLATNPRYLTGSKTASDQLSLYDLAAHKFIDVPAGYGADVHGETLAVYTLQGNLQFYRVGQPAVVLGGRLPLNELPRLQAVVVDSSLSTLAISVRGSGVIFDLQTGHRLATTPSFSGAVFDSAQRAFLLNATQPGHPASVALWDGHKSESTPRPMECGQWKRDLSRQQEFSRILRSQRVRPQHCYCQSYERSRFSVTGSRSCIRTRALETRI